MCNLGLVEWYNSFIWKYEIPTLKILVKLFFQEHVHTCNYNGRFVKKKN